MNGPAIVWVAAPVGLWLAGLVVGLTAAMELVERWRGNRKGQPQGLPLR